MIICKVEKLKIKHGMYYKNETYINFCYNYNNNDRIIQYKYFLIVSK